MKKAGVVALLLVLVLKVVADANPTQVHLSLTGAQDEMTITWMTDDDADSIAVYWSAPNNSSKQSVTGTSSRYYLPLPPYQSPLIHYVTLTGLDLDTTYNYQVGGSQGWSQVFNFLTEQKDRHHPVVVASVADHGVSNNSQMVTQALINARETYNYQLLIHAGDISYANGIEHWWDFWGNMVQPFAAYTPWMAGVGNHEILDLYLAYLYRFAMPATQSGATQGNLFFSYNYGSVHFIALSSEMIEYWESSDQYQWLLNDLQSVDRSVTPWIVAYWHSPWYCSNQDHYGSGDSMKAAFEDMFYKYKVDIVVNGHVHAYERTTTVYQGNIVEDAPVYIVNGLGGNNEGIAKKWYDQPNWSVKRDDSGWGFATMVFHNATHFQWTMTRAIDSETIDEFWLVRDRK